MDLALVTEKYLADNFAYAIKGGTPGTNDILIMDCIQISDRYNVNIAGISNYDKRCPSRDQISGYTLTTTTLPDIDVGRNLSPLLLTRSTSVYLRGKFTSSVPEAFLSYGFCISSSSTPTIANEVFYTSATQSSYDSSTYYFEFLCGNTGWTTETSYYARAFVTYGSQTVYGAVYRFVPNNFTPETSGWGGYLVNAYYETTSYKGIDGSTIGGQLGVPRLLIMASSNVSNGAWGVNGQIPVYSEGTTYPIDGGLGSTQYIVNANPSDSTIVAARCRGYSGGGYLDWYLPNIYEYQQAKAYIPDYLGSYSYWTRDQYSMGGMYNYAYYYNSALETSDYISRTISAPARPMRAVTY